MTLRTIFTTQEGVNPPAFGKIPGQDAYYPLLQVDDVTGVIYNGGAPLVGTSDLTTKVNNVVVDLSVSDILNLKATPKVIIPALPAGFMVQPLLATFQYQPVSVDYTLGNASQIFIGSAVNPTNVTILQPLAASILNGAGGPGNTVGVMSAANALSAAQSWFEGQDLVLTHNGSAELTLGDGTVTVKIYYAVIAL